MVVRGPSQLRDAGRWAAALRARWRQRLSAALARSARFRQAFPGDELAGRLASVAQVLGPTRLEVTRILHGTISALIEVYGAEVVEQSVAEALQRLGPEARRLKARSTLLAATLNGLASSAPSRARAFGEENIPRAESKETATLLARLHERAGAIVRPLELLRPYEDSASALVEQLAGDEKLLTGGMPDPAPGGRGQACLTPQSDRRVLYYVSQSRPHHSSGYAIRTHYLLRALAASHWDVACFARFGYPNDRYDYRGQPRVADRAEVDGVPYVFRPAERGVRALGAEAYQRAAVRTLMDQARRFRPALIHCASNYVVGQAGTEAARRLGLPSIYEIRGLWHVTRASKQPDYDRSDHFQLSQKLEVQAANRADHVFAITDAVRDVLLEGGVPEERVTLLPNSVDVDHFVPRPRDLSLAASVGLGDEIVIGFVGSFVDYEGLELLLEAAARLRAELGEAFQVLLVGDGAAMDDLRRRSQALGIDDRVIFTGRVPHTEVLRYYSLIDIAVYPRRGVPVCELVSPLKPLEAMAMGKAVLVSDVRAQTEMVAHEQTGLVHQKDDVQSLTHGLTRLLGSRQLREQLGEAGRQWVRAERSWAAATSIVGAVYRELLGRRE